MPFPRITSITQHVLGHVMNVFITLFANFINWTTIRKVSTYIFRSFLRNKKQFVLYETKSFRRARERTYLQWPLDSYPSRMTMKEAGWFIVRHSNDEFVAVCPYCKKACKRWNQHHDPYKVHKFLSPSCIFILFAYTIETSSPSSIVECVPRREQVRPSSHRMARVYERMNSFNHYSHASPHPPFDTLVEAGLYYTRQTTMVKCFSCQRITSFSQPNYNPMSAHTNRCEYARHLRVQSQRAPLDIQASEKVYELVGEQVNNTTFYFLRCISSSATPGILLAANICLPNGGELETSDKNLRRLRPSEQLKQNVNWVTSSDGPLVNILHDLANNSMDLTDISDDLRCSTEEFSISSTNSRNNSIFQCKTCSTRETSPHIVSTQCCHLGLCSRKCFAKWMTCVICGYALGKSMRIYEV